MPEPETFLPQPGDVINTRPWKKKAWWKIWGYVFDFLTWAIQRHQRKLGFKNWKDTHTMQVFRSSHLSCGGLLQVFSYTYPECKWESWDAVKKRCWYCYRPTFPITTAHIGYMRVAAVMQLGKHYNVWQLVNIGLNRILGYKTSKYKRFVDIWKTDVCSVGVRVNFDYMRKRYEAHGVKPPFLVLFEDEEGNKVHVERTTPAHFANTPQMFELVATWEGELGSVPVED